MPAKKSQAQRLIDAVKLIQSQDKVTAAAKSNVKELADILVPTVFSERHWFYRNRYYLLTDYVWYDRKKGNFYKVVFYTGSYTVKLSANGLIRCLTEIGDDIKKHDDVNVKLRRVIKAIKASLKLNGS